MPDQQQPGPEKKKPKGWNIRPFDKDLRIACQTQASKEDMYDYEWVQNVLRDALDLPPATTVLDSTHESGKEEIRRDPEQADSNRTGKTRRRKARPKA
jgi:hypothetical protein